MKTIINSIGVFVVILVFYGLVYLCASFIAWDWLSVPHDLFPVFRFMLLVTFILSITIALDAV